jgi:very-short-patch-repair endonuclease
MAALLESPLLLQFPAGSVRCLFSSDVAEARLNLAESVSHADQDVRLVTIALKRLGAIDSLLQQFLASLAETALLLWPDWYDGSLAPAAVANLSEQSLIDRTTTRRLVQTSRSINAAWLRGALFHCRAGRAPVPPKFSLAQQVEQLSLALADVELLIAVCVEDCDPSASALLGLSRGAEWLAREAGAQVLVVLPACLADRRELDGISSGAAVSDGPAPKAHALAERLDECKQIVPIIGRPHPGSPGEQLLAQELARDSQLGPLFRFNERVRTVFDSRYLVDLVWAAGRVVVEIDGYGYHCTQAAFNADRHRDYELTLSGYVVLRLPHDFVVQDPRLALERVRELVEFRTQHPFVENEAPDELRT